MVQVVLIFRILAKQQVRKKPFADEKPFFTKFVVYRHAQLVGEVKVQIIALHRIAFGFEQSREGPQLDRGVDMKPEGHIYQSNIQRHGRIVTVLSDTWLAT